MRRASRRSAACCINGDARSLHRSDGNWRVDADEGHVDSENVVVALGPWAPDVLTPLGIKLPLGIKRGYHRHYNAEGQRVAVAADHRHRIRLCADPDGAGHPPHHRRGVRGARCRADAGTVRSAAAAPRASCFRSASRTRPSRGSGGGRHAGFAARDRPRAGPEGTLARVRPRPLGADDGARSPDA